jgi:orotidine-5'-phosphate decarboxylase
MTRAELIAQIRLKHSCLCVGLDTDIHKIPKHLLKEKNPILAFNKAIIDATKDYCVAYKPNLAFYEVLGARGWEILEETLAYIPSSHFTIADAKRGDIGNTSKMYAKTFFETYNFDSVTIAPYMGSDSVQPFLEFEGKWAILLALTSNTGAQDFERLKLENDSFVYQEVVQKAQEWGTTENLMYVVGATAPDALKDIRRLAPDHFFLIPGVGAQGGDLDEVMQAATNKDVGVLVNASRSILYGNDSLDFQKYSEREAIKLAQVMKQWCI